MSCAFGWNRKVLEVTFPPSEGCKIKHQQLIISPELTFSYPQREKTSFPKLRIAAFSTFLVVA
jgi:hypothetical protein